MRISELAETTGVPVHTLKFYLREGVLPPGDATSRTRADYGEAHVERVRLVRALVEHGGVSIGDIRSIVGALDSPPPSRHELLGVAHRTLPGVTAGAEVSAEVVELLEGLGWTSCTDGPLAAGLTAAVAAARGPGSSSRRRSCAGTPRRCGRWRRWMSRWPCGRRARPAP